MTLLLPMCLLLASSVVLFVWRSGRTRRQPERKLPWDFPCFQVEMLSLGETAEFWYLKSIDFRSQKHNSSTWDPRDHDAWIHFCFFCLLNACIHLLRIHHHVEIVDLGCGLPSIRLCLLLWWYTLQHANFIASSKNHSSILSHSGILGSVG